MDSQSGAVIIGAAGTIGRATADLFAARYQTLFLIDNNEAALREMVTHYPNAQALVADATNSLQLDDAFTAIKKHGAKAVVLAVGTEGQISAIEDSSDEEFDRVLCLNVKSVWLGLKRSLRIMKPQGFGSIVALSSISGVLGTPLLAPYSASKHAVMGLVRTAAREAAPFNVRVNAVCPAPVESDMMRRIDFELSEKFPERLRGQKDAMRSVPMQRYARAEEVAQAIAFLCSDASSYCSGSAFTVDGGISCH